MRTPLLTAGLAALLALAGVAAPGPDATHEGGPGGLGPSCGGAFYLARACLFTCPAGAALRAEGDVPAANLGIPASVFVVASCGGTQAFCGATSPNPGWPARCAHDSAWDTFAGAVGVCTGSFHPLWPYTAGMGAFRCSSLGP